MKDDEARPLDISLCGLKAKTKGEIKASKRSRSWNEARNRLMKTHDCFHCHFFDINRCNPLNGCAKEKENEG